jgi:tetratricopeptide (TPR) repeat protein
MLCAVTTACAATAAARAQTPAPPPVPPAGGLPPIACVEAVRAARIAGNGADTAAARAKLEAALDLPGCELPALAAMLPLLRAGAYPPERAAALRDRLAGRLADAAFELPDGLLTQIASTGIPGDDDLFLAALERRLAHFAPADDKASRPGLVELLDVTSELQQRRGKYEAARDTLARLLALQPSDELRWRAIYLDIALTRWASLADLLAPMLKEPDTPTPLREHYVRALAHLGRFDEMTRQIELLTPPPPPVPGLEPATASRYVSTLVDAAWALRDAGRDDQAQQIFHRVLAHDPNQAEAQLALLHLYGTAEERAAQAQAVAARRESLTDPLPLFEEGSDLLGAGDAQGARDLLARAAPQLGGTDYAEPAWYNLGAAAFKLERWEEAANALGEAIAVNPARVESHYKRGIALFHLERCRDAVAALRRTLELQPDKRDTHYYLAGCYTKLGDAAAAARENAIFNAKP